MTMEDTKTGAPVHDERETSQEIQTASAHRDVDEHRVTPQGRRLRKWLILANIVGWVLVILAARVIFF